MSSVLKDAGLNKDAGKSKTNFKAGKRKIGRGLSEGNGPPSWQGLPSAPLSGSSLMVHLPGRLRGGRES